ncbi:MAG: sterol-binding protein, partial [Mesorhizobium sp.]
MGVQEIADKIRSQVASAGFEHSVKFDTGSDGVIVIDGATVSTADAPTD